MTRQQSHHRDDDLRQLFQDLRHEDEREAPQFTGLRWVREMPETPSTHRRRLALAGVAATLITAGIAAGVVSVRMAPGVSGVGPTLPTDSIARVRKYTPPPPKIERKIIPTKKKLPVPLPVDQIETLRSLGFVGAAEAEPSSEYRRLERKALQQIARNARFELSEVEPYAPGLNTESYAAIEDNPFHLVADEPLSTLSIDVDTAAYSNVRRFLNEGRRPPRDAVRIEELINYFDYEHPAPRGDDPFGVATEVADCPWNPEHRLARITLGARRENRGAYRGSNLVFLIDASGSMRPPNKLPLVKAAMSMLADQLDGNDTVTIVVYASASGLVLPPTPGSDRATIREALDRLEAGGSTAGGEGLRLAYRLARENFIVGGVNRVILATDGDFNVGVTSHSQLLAIIEQDAKRGVFLTALGFGMGNLQDDRLEQLADRGNGNYAYIDDLREARKVLVEEIGGTLVTVAKDVKIQVEFNPLEVGAYRLIGYENRLLAHRDFNDDTKDAGEIGAGHTVTALYELVPSGRVGTRGEVDPLRYQGRGSPNVAAVSGELLTLKIRFKRPDEDVSVLRTYAVKDGGVTLDQASNDLRFAAAVAAFGMRLRESPEVRELDWSDIDRLGASALDTDAHGHRQAFLELVERARTVAP